MRSHRLYKTEGIVLKRHSIGETDRILTLFTKHYGKLRVLAKGIRSVKSRRAAHLEIFTRVALILHKGRQWDSVIEATSLSTYAHLRMKLRTVSFAYYLCELVDSLLPERQEHRDVYELCIQYLESLDSGSGIASDYLMEHYTGELLHVLGYRAGNTSGQIGEMQRYVERIIERRLRTPKFLTQLDGIVS